jgi:hypothetical protein
LQYGQEEASDTEDNKSPAAHLQQDAFHGRHVNKMHRG